MIKEVNFDRICQNGLLYWSQISKKEASYDEFIIGMGYVHEKDRGTNKEKYKIPGFLLVANNMFAYPGIFLPERSFNAYSLVEKGEDFWIFHLKN